jgi:HAD superfamily hydrolase (TIGR01549 family)
LQALIFDLDGTLYEQAPLRRAIFFRLLAAYLAHPLDGVTAWQVLRRYRQAQEMLRSRTEPSNDLGGEQMRLACSRLGLNVEAVAPLVTRWMDREPLPLLRRFRRAGAAELLREAKKSGLRLALWSDYPAERKLEALGIREYFDLIVTAQDPAVGCFKPNPAGLNLILSSWGIRGHQALFIGDRSDVDGVAAQRAGVPYLQFGGRRVFEGLSALLAGGAGR